MGRIPRDVVDAIRDRTDIVEVVGRHVTLQKRGSSWVGLCPFHQEKSPSFNVIPSKGIFHCFGCQAGGDVFKFVMLLEGLSFVECVRELAGPAGVDIPERELTPAERQQLRARATLYDVLEEAAGFYEKVLWTQGDGEPGRRYLEQRQIERDAARAARIGFAPGGWTRLIDHLHRAGFSEELVREAGLARARRTGDGSYDAFRDRLVFPIRDDRGRVLGFGGRLLEGDGPKYINSPETPLYEKSHILYGLHHARAAIQRKDRAVVVEGYFDVVSMHQGGFDETIATCGTALTPAHVKRLRRLTRNVVLVMDSDNAGMRAAERSLPLFLSAGMQAWRIELPGAKDPDELLREEGASVMEAALVARSPLLEWVVDRKLASYGRQSPLGVDVDAVGRARVVEDLVPLLATQPDRQLSDTVARRVGVPELVLWQQVQAGTAAPPREVEPEAGWRPDRDVVHLIWLLVHRYDQVADLLAQVPPAVLSGHPQVQPVVARLATGEPVAAVQQDAADPGVARALRAIVARQVLYAPEEAPAAVCHVLERLTRRRRNQELDDAVRTAEAALRDGDFAGFRQATALKAERVRQERRLEQLLSAGNPGAFAAALAGCIPGATPENAG
ncbi:MAG: DNA primase [Myxococcota bacterium]|jgi:DNA primase